MHQTPANQPIPDPISAFVTPATEPPARTSRARLDSIDLLRGIVMVIMMLDHTRDFVHSEVMLGHDPTNLSQTTVWIFFTRWITHFCAPVFVFLSGTSAFLVGERKGTKALSWFLFSRGL